MTKKTQLMQDLLQAGLMAALLAVALPDLAMAAGGTTGAAGGDLGATTENFARNQLKALPNLIAAVCYIVGIGLMVGGTLKLRAHAENPGQTPLAQGASRLIVGGVIAALPSFIGWVNATTMVSGTKLSFDNSLNNAFN